MYMKQGALNLKEISTGLDIAKLQLTNIILDLELGGYLVQVPDKNEEKKWTNIFKRLSKNLTILSDEERLDLNLALHKVNVLLKGWRIEK
jgi:hypothetical protein